VLRLADLDLLPEASNLYAEAQARRFVSVSNVEASAQAENVGNATYEVPIGISDNQWSYHLMYDHGRRGDS
jgi:hypothetical protein